MKKNLFSTDVLVLCLLFISQTMILNAAETDGNKSVLSLPKYAQTKPVMSLDVKDGDTFMFAGDSITYGHKWPQCVETYFYTRYPDKKINFLNTSIGGGRSWWLEGRMEDAVLRYKPQHVILFLGMNDGRYGEFNKALYTKYKSSMTNIIERLRNIGTNVILMAPPQHDPRARLTGMWVNHQKKPGALYFRKGVKEALEPDIKNYNGFLLTFGNWLRQKAENEGMAFVDPNSLASNITTKNRAKDNLFRLSDDGIHPNWTGDMLFAYALLNQLDCSDTVSNIHIFNDGSSWKNKAENGSLKGLKASNESISFSFLSKSLPWVAPSEAEEGWNLLNANKLSKEILRINGLTPGVYTLKIDGVLIGEYSYMDLAKGIELQENAKTPQYKQALKIRDLVKKSAAITFYGITKPWFSYARIGQRIWEGKEPKPYEKPQIDLKDSKNENLRKHWKNLVEEAKTWDSKVAEAKELREKTVKEALVKKAKLTEEIYKVNQPVLHNYEIIKIK